MDREIIEKYKKENGNKNFTLKEMLWYVIHQQDELKNKLDDKVGKVTFRWVISGISVFFITIMGLIFRYKPL